MNPAVGYLRKSRSDDPTKEVSRDVQEQAVRTLAAEDGYGDVELFIDWDRSADESKSKRRTAYSAMLRRIETGSVRVVYAYSVDRLYRSLSGFLRLTETANKCGIRIVTKRDGTVGGDGSPMAAAFAQIGAVFTELELNTAKARARSAYEARVRRGDFIGHPPYGHQIVKGPDGVNRLEDDPDHPVQPVLDAYDRAGKRMRTAVRILNDDLRIPAKQGGAWDRQSLLRVIEREAPDLLPQRTANHRREDAPTPALLAKLLRCHCGRLLTPNRHIERRRSVPSVSVAYYCALGNASRSNHPRVYVSELKLLSWVREEAGRLRTPDRLTVEAEADAERERHEARRARLLDQYEAGDIDRDRYRQRLDAITVALGRLDAQLTVVDVPAIDWDAPTEDINAVLRSIFRYVQLDRNLIPLRAEWTVPQWRAD